MELDFILDKINKMNELFKTHNEIEYKHSIHFAKGLKKELKGLSDSKEISSKEDIYKIVDTLTQESYERGKITFTHSQLLHFKETMFHLGCLDTSRILSNNAKSLLSFDVSSKNSGKQLLPRNAQIIDSTEYSTFPVDFYLIIGGMNSSISKNLQEETFKLCKDALATIMMGVEPKRVEDGVIVRTPIQNIPTVLKLLVMKEIAVYGVIPL